MGGLETPSTSHRAPAGVDGKDRQTKVGPHYVCMRGIYIRSNQCCQTSQGAHVPHPQPLEELLSKSPLLADLLQAEAEEEVIRRLLAPKALFLLLSHWFLANALVACMVYLGGLHRQARKRNCDGCGRSSVRCFTAADVLPWRKLFRVEPSLSKSSMRRKM
jgi:hypothetical protein